MRLQRFAIDYIDRLVEERNDIVLERDVVEIPAAGSESISTSMSLSCRFSPRATEPNSAA